MFLCFARTPRQACEIGTLIYREALTTDGRQNVRIPEQINNFEQWLLVSNLRKRDTFCNFKSLLIENNLN